MSTIAFHPDTVNYIKNKSKQLQKAFHGVTLSQAREITSVALGYQSWHDACEQLKTKNRLPPIYIEDMIKPLQLERRHAQFCALVDYGQLPPAEVSYFVRAWGLGSKEQARYLSQAISTYDQLIADINESGPLNYEEHDGVLVEICDGVIYTDCISHKDNCYYVVDARRFKELPAFIRGNSSSFLEWEGGSDLYKYIPEIEEPAKALGIFSPFNPGAHHHTSYELEWQGITKLQKTGSFTLSQLLKDSCKHPNSRYALSYRSWLEQQNHEWIYLPTLSGTQMSEMIENKGSLLVRDVQWYKMKKKHSLSLRDLFESFNSIRLKNEDIQPCKPFFDTPFKHCIMGDIEYDFNVECSGLFYDDSLLSEPVFDEV